MALTPAMLATFLLALGPASATLARALVPGLDQPIQATYATPSLRAGYGFLHYCTDCSHQPPVFSPWALLTYLHSSYLDDSITTALANNATAIIVIVDKLSDDTRLVNRYVMKNAYDNKYLRKLQEIPVITIERANGERLEAVTRSIGKLPIYISPVDTVRDETIFLLSLALSIVVFIICVFGFQICGRKEQRIPISVIQTPYQSAVEKIPTQEITNAQDQVLDDENKCAVCIEGYQVTEIISFLPCGHIFHKDCIEPWLLSKRLCPMCKMDIIKFYGPINLGSEESIVDIPLDESIMVNNMEPDEESISS